MNLREIGVCFIELYDVPQSTKFYIEQEFGEVGISSFMVAVGSLGKVKIPRKRGFLLYARGR